MDPIESLIPDDSGAAPALEPLAMVALDAGRMLMEAGASANGVDEIVAKFARGLGAERVDLRIGYASLAVTIGIGANGITRMREVGHLGVNQRLDQELWHLAARVSRRELTAGTDARGTDAARDENAAPFRVGDGGGGGSGVRGVRPAAEGGLAGHRPVFFAAASASSSGANCSRAM